VGNELKEHVFSSSHGEEISMERRYPFYDYMYDYF
jgi:hypothetical protein